MTKTLSFASILYSSTEPLTRGFVIISASRSLAFTSAFAAGLFLAPDFPEKGFLASGLVFPAFFASAFGAKAPLGPAGLL
jgi:hypothetical protein